MVPITETNEMYITTPITIMSFTLTIMSTAVAIIVILYFFNYLNASQLNLPSSSRVRSNSKIDTHSNSDNVQKTTRKAPNNIIEPYFKYCASIVVIFNALCSIFTTIYCLNLLWDPQSNDDVFYISHPSHIHRIISTTFWYVAQVALIWFFNGRLYHVFIGTSFGVSRTFFLVMNTIITAVAPFSVFWGYYSVYTGHLVGAEIAFNSFRIIYELSTFIILYKFSKRLLLLTITEQSIAVNADGKDDENAHFLNVITRNSVLVLVISIAADFVTFSYTAFRFIFLPQTRLTLLIPLNVASLDSLITSISIICLFHVGNNMYKILCNCCHVRFKRICSYFAKKSLLSNVAGMELAHNLPRVQASRMPTTMDTSHCSLPDVPKLTTSKSAATIICMEMAESLPKLHVKQYSLPTFVGVTGLKNKKNMDSSMKIALNEELI